MNQKTYVQHISGQGRKFIVLDDNPFCWKVTLSNLEQDCWVPKCEYIISGPPEEWEDVTGEFIVTEGSWPSTSRHKSNAIICANTGYVFLAPHEMHHSSDLRLNKIDGLHHGPAFIVERKKS